APAAGRTPPPPLAGRTEELGQLLDAWRRVRQQRQSSCILLRADPGVGKSRLLHELGKRLNASQPARQVTLRCLEPHLSNPFYPVAELIYHLCAFLPGSGPEQRYRKLSDLLQRLFQLDGEGIDLIADLLGLPLPADSAVAGMPRDSWRARMLDTLLAVVRSGPGQPLLLVVEDVHWADASTLQLIERLLREPK